MILDQDLKDKIVSSITSSVKANRIILFGSYAYGNPDINSDLDLLVIEDSFESKILEKRKIREALKDIRVAKDILVSDIREYDFYKNEYGSVFMDIDKRGEILWQG